MHRYIWSTKGAHDMRLTVIHPDGREEERRPKGKHFTLNEWRDAIGGGWIEQLRAPNGDTVLVDEEGRLKDLPFNPRASARAGRPLFGIVAFGPGELR
jgi:hypothetical protein